MSHTTTHRPSLEERAAQAEHAGFERACVVKLAYKGTDFCGFAAQPGLRTVEGELSEAFSVLLKRPCELSCAGRTDAGVHAQAQYVSLPLKAGELTQSAETLMNALDALTGTDISIRGVYAAPAGFSARFDALARSYRYRIKTGPARPVLGADMLWWHRRELDTDAMQEGLSYLIGVHDFKSFCKLASAQDKNTEREILSASVSCVHEYNEDLIVMDICGSAFLHSMVRTVMGTLTEVGLHKREPAWVGEVLKALDRAAAGQTAPAQGLCFMDVAYSEGLLTSWDSSRA